MSLLPYSTRESSIGGSSISIRFRFSSRPQTARRTLFLSLLVIIVLLYLYFQQQQGHNNASFLYGRSDPSSSAAAAHLLPPAFDDFAALQLDNADVDKTAAQLVLNLDFAARKGRTVVGATKDSSSSSSKSSKSPSALPNSASPFARMPLTWPGHRWLSEERFGSSEDDDSKDEEDGAESSGSNRMGSRDPPFRAEPSADHLAAAYAFTAARAAYEPHDAAKKLHYDERSGRVRQVHRKELSMERTAGWDREFAGGLLDAEKRKTLPRIQVDPLSMTAKELKTEKERREWVKRAFRHAWEGYKGHAWGEDQVRPLSSKSSNPFGGWGVTLVDSLDTLLIMGLSQEYNLAREHVRRIDFSYLSPRDITPLSSSTLPDLSLLIPAEESSYSTQATFHTLSSSRFESPESVSTFETIIRYLGGMLSAYDLSSDPIMLARATELADWLLPSLDTAWGFPMGCTELGAQGGHVANSFAEIASLTLEFTRLSMLTLDDIYFNAAQRIIDTLDTRFEKVPAGKKPNIAQPFERRGAMFSAAGLNPSSGTMDYVYSFGAMADSGYEYLIKQHQLLQGAHPQYEKMYAEAIDSAYEYGLIQEVTVVPGRDDLSIFGLISRGRWTAHLEHLTCFAGGMMALGSRLLGREKDFDTGIRVTNACVWVYESSATGVGPESTTFYANEEKPVKYVNPQLPVGVKHGESRYIGRPETIESVFYMYRTTGDRKWQDKGWRMFVSWVENSIAPAGFCDLSNVHVSPAMKVDSMESFVLAETLKYYFLLFSDTDFISLDDFVFNTEAHPFRIPKASNHPLSHSPATGLLWTASPLNKTATPAPPSSTVTGEGTINQLYYRIQQAAELGPAFYAAHPLARDEVNSVARSREAE